MRSLFNVPANVSLEGHLKG